MNHLVRSFQEYLGIRGCHFYDNDKCTFLVWDDVFRFIDSLPKIDEKAPFSEKLADTLSNYNPDKEFLAVYQNGDSVSVELYCQNEYGSGRY